MTISGGKRCRFFNHALARIACAALILVALSGCRRVSVNDRAPMSVTLTSGSFREGDNIPQQFTCRGANISPALTWSGLPPDTRSLALVVSDKDSLFGSYVHWVLYNVPPAPNHIAEGVPTVELLPNGARQGTNSGDTLGYSGPCPPGSSAHRYIFRLYALNATLNPPSPVHKDQLMNLMEGHVLARAELMGRYHR